MTEDTRMAWGGSCAECGAVVIIYPGDDSSAETHELIADGEWEGFPSCYVCDGTIEWNGSDPVHHLVPRA